MSNGQRTYAGGPAPQRMEDIGSDEWIESKLAWLQARAPKPQPRGLQEGRQRGLVPEYIARPAPRSMAELIESGRVRKRVFQNLHHGKLEAPKAIVLHRTAGPTAESTLSAYRNQREGAHLLIDNDGTIYLTADLDQQTWHVGMIRSRAKEEQKLSKEDEAFFKDLGKYRAKERYPRIHAAESRKPYPSRYPQNSDSIGIEVVGSYDKKTKTFTSPTERQLESLQLLLDVLEQERGISRQDIYRHGVISYKDENRTEGGDMGY